MFAPNRKAMRFVLAALFVFACTGPALANLSICNRASHPARIALGRFNGTDWMSEGWWNVKAGKCQPLITGALKARFYYLYAADGSSGGWPGSHDFCVGNGESFQVFGRDNCAGRGFDRKSFYEIDTEQRSDFTSYISD
jgi:uncharacterized membrane protein